MIGPDASEQVLARALGSRTVPARLDALAAASGSPERTLRAALNLLDRTDSNAVWLALAVLLGEFPTAQTVTDFRRWATLDGPAAALGRAARSTRSHLRPRRMLAVVEGARILVDGEDHRAESGILRASWSRDHRTLMVDGRAILPVRSTVVVIGLLDHAGAADRLGSAATASGNRLIAPAVGTGPLANEPGGPVTAATWATHLTCLAHFSVLVAPDEVIAEDARGWASMLPGLGLEPPRITVAPGSSVEQLFSA